ncbi:MAG: TIM44-related membrane protein TimA [Caulobacteraceae bacterium]
MELLLAAAVAAVVLSMLYSVVGKRIGRQPEEVGERAGARANVTPARLDEQKTSVPITGLAAIRAKDSSFDADKFLDGARAAYKIIVTAYAEGDAEQLAKLTTPAVRQAFERGIAQRQAEGRTETIEFLSPPRADFESMALVGELARVRVRFLAELRSRTKDIKGEGLDDRRTAEIWTFERIVPSKDPNWALARVEAAEA